MKKWFSKLKQDRKGSVSLFFILITAIVFAFNAVLIDYARILAVEQQTEYALQSATRSALAGYSNALRKYGLFAIESGEAETIFNKVITENLEIDTDERFFNYVQPTVESYSLNASRPLVEIDILEHQILEEMKYKAPVEIVLNLIDNFSFLADAMKSASEFIDIAEAVQEPFENREALLDKSETFLNGDEEEEEIGMNDRLESFNNNMNSTDYSTYPAVNYFSDIVYHFQKYLDTTERIEQLETENEELTKANEELATAIEELKEKKTQLEKDIEGLEETIAELEEDVSEEERTELEEQLEELEEELKETEEEINNKELQKLGNESTIETNQEKIEEEKSNMASFKENAEDKATEMYNLADGIIRDLEEISNSIEIAKVENQKIIDAIATAEAQANENYGDAMAVEGDSPDTSNIDEAVQKMQEEMEKVKDYPYEPEYFDQIKEPIDDALESFDGVLDDLRPIKNSIDSVSKSSMDYRFNQVKSSGDSAGQSTSEGTDQLVDERKDFDQDVDAEEENLIEAEKSNSEIFDLLKSIEGLINEEVYDELAAILAEYDAYAEAASGAEIDFSDDSSGSAKDAMGLLDTLFRDLGDALLNARDKLYVNEYILMYFESAKPKAPFTNPDNFKFENRQVEYIIYGLHEPGANYAAALAQLFAIRFAINFIDAFADPMVRAATHPLAVFVAALRYALFTSLENVKSLASGDAVPLMDKMIGRNPSFNYHDYLRLFLFMNPGTDARFRRISAVIEHDTGKKMTEQMTYVEGEVKSSKQLLFVPEIARMISYTGALNGVVEGNRFEFERNAHLSY